MAYMPTISMWHSQAMAEAMKADWGEVPMGKGSNVCWFSWGLMGFIDVAVRCSGFLMGFTCVFNGIYSVLMGFNYVLMGFNCVLMGFTGLPWYTTVIFNGIYNGLSGEKLYIPIGVIKRGWEKSPK